VSENKGVVGITALSLLAFMAQGHQEGLGEFGTGRYDVLRRGVNYLLSRSLPPSSSNPLVAEGGSPVGYIFFAEDPDSRMHGHCYATQALVLAYGSGRSKTFPELKEKILRAIRVIEDSQTITGGWGYEPKRAGFHEGSITVTAVQALRLARDAGFVIDKEVQRRGLAYLRDSQRHDGSFKYSMMSDLSTPALTAAALTALHGFGEYYGRVVDTGLQYLLGSYQDSGGAVTWPFYSHYYTAQAFYRAGGKHWTYWSRAMVPEILRHQSAGGFWDDADFSRLRRGSHGRAYATAFAVLALSVPDGMIPLFQR
jgi:hypothetical protein